MCPRISQDNMSVVYLLLKVHHVTAVWTWISNKIMAGETLSSARHIEIILEGFTSGADYQRKNIFLAIDSTWEEDNQKVTWCKTHPHH